MISAQFRIELPPDEWVKDVSEAFPQATFRLLSGVRTGGTARELGEVRAEDPAAVGEAIREHPSTVTYETLELTDDRLLSKYETTDVGLYGFLEASALPPEFPVEVVDGRYELDLTGTREEFDRVRAALEASPFDYELVSKVHSDRGGTLLTDRQREVLSAALRAGYLEVPRSCTLAELAADLDADKSTVSGVLRRAQARLAAWYLTGDPGEPPR